jgi:hypothetical protein
MTMDRPAISAGKVIPCLDSSTRSWQKPPRSAGIGQRLDTRLDASHCGEQILDTGPSLPVWGQLWSGGDVFINQAKIAATDVLAGNGIIHVIEGVLMP